MDFTHTWTHTRTHTWDAWVWVYGMCELQRPPPFPVIFVNSTKSRFCFFFTSSTSLPFLPFSPPPLHIRTYTYGSLQQLFLTKRYRCQCSSQIRFPHASTCRKRKEKKRKKAGRAEQGLLVWKLGNFPEPMTLVSLFWGGWARLGWVRKLVFSFSLSFLRLSKSCLAFEDCFPNLDSCQTLSQVLSCNCMVLY